jgi:hypothetical protein
MAEGVVLDTVPSAIRTNHKPRIAVDAPTLRSEEFEERIRSVRLVSFAIERTVRSLG